MKAVITTLGTSLLRNFSQDKERKLPEWLYEPASKKEEYKDEIKNLTYEINGWFDHVEKSAESATLSQLKEHELRFYFLASDSIATLIVAKVLQKYYKKNSPHIEIVTKVVDELSMKNRKSFQKGIDNLITEVLEILKKENEAIFNITAGYKGVIPYFSTIAQIFGAQLIYDFEGAENRLITIDPLPIEFDRSFFELLYPYIAEKNFQDVKIRMLLEELRIITPQKELTPLGRIVLYATEKHMMNKSALGYFLEYLLYAYLSQRASFRDFHFQKIEVGKKFYNRLKTKTLSDIDIYLENGTNIFWLEVKPHSVFAKPSTLRKQFFQKQLRVIKTLPKPLYRYGVIFYGIDKQPPTPNRNIKKFAKQLKEHGYASGFYYMPLSLSIDKKMLTPQNYQSLIQNFEIPQIYTIFEIEK